jgi:hypothetical protein
MLDRQPVAKLGVAGRLDASPAVPEGANPEGVAVLGDSPTRHDLKEVV